MKEKGADDSKLSNLRDRIKKQADSIKDKMDKLKEACIPFREEVVFKGHDVELWKGKFDRNCFEFNYP